VYTVFEDIMERRRAEEELRHASQFMQAVQDTVDAIIVVLDRKGGIVRIQRPAGGEPRWNHRDRSSRPVRCKA